MSKQPRSLQEFARMGLPLDGPFVFDAHMHLGEWFQFYMPVRDAAGAVGIMDRIGINAGIASALGAAAGSDYRAGNDLVIAAAREFPGRLYGYAVVDPNDPDGMVPELERCARAGVKAVKIHTYHGKPYDAPEYAPAFEFADKRGWPVLAHGAAVDMFDAFAGKYPNVRWILAHSSTPDAAQFAPLARRHENIFFDTCVSACEVGAVEALVKAVGLSRVLFGSDALFLSAAQQIGAILFARLSDSDKEAILGLNALKVFDLPKPSAAASRSDRR